MSDCQHTQIRTWFYDDTRELAGMWSCTDCGRKFEPVNLDRDADAARYQWLRDKARSVDWTRDLNGWSWEQHCRIGPQGMDAAIDAARKVAP